MTSEHPRLPPCLTPELTVADRRQKREIRQLEQELHKWQVLVDSITGEAAGDPGRGGGRSPLQLPLPHPEPLCLPGWLRPHYPRPGSLPSTPRPSGGLCVTPAAPPRRHELS